jgi:type IV secretory system conjugative DNA transfer VirD4/TraG family protein
MSDGPGRPPFRFADIAIPLVMLGVGVAATIVAAVAWLGGVLAADAHTLVPTPIWPILRALTEAGRAGSLDPVIGPAGSRLIFWMTTGVLALLILGGGGVLGWWATQRLDRVGSVARSLGRGRDYRDMRGQGAVRRAVSLRPSLAAQPTVARGDIGLRLGRLGRHDLFAAEEDVLLHVAGPRSNKTSALVVPAVLSAPGPLIATSNKVDLHILTSGLRALVGRVFIFDPQHIAGVEQTWWWNPLAAIRDVSDAHHLVAHFSQTVGAGHERADPYFTKGAERLLAQLCLAAAGSGHHLRDVQHWLATRSEIPVQLLRTAGHDRVAAALLGTIEAPADQRGGLYETALTAIACLESEAVLRYVTPPSTWVSAPRDTRIDQFDPWQFLTGYYLNGHGHPSPHDSLYLLTREGAGTAAPVVAALVDHLLRTTAAAATASGGRVDPPVRAVLDEAANICPIRNLPDLYSYFGSMSIQVLSFLQSYQQGVHLWGRAGMDKLWSAATVKLIGAGVHDPSFCEDLSRLVGDHDVATWTHQHGRHGHLSTSTRRDRILSAADIARLQKTQAVLLSAGRKAGLIRLLPWYTERDGNAQAIKDHAAEATAQVREAATAALGPDNPLTRVLTAAASTT